MGGGLTKNVNLRTNCLHSFSKTCPLVEPEIGSEGSQQRNSPSRGKRSVIYHLMILLLTAELRADQISADAETGFWTSWTIVGLAQAITRRHSHQPLEQKGAQPYFTQPQHSTFQRFNDFFC